MAFAYTPHWQEKKKGQIRPPYAIADYRATNPEYGNMEDFIDLVDTIHKAGMKVWIDVVYNHTSPDSYLKNNYPQWFYHNDRGDFGNRIGEWSDIIDLDYSNKQLWDYQIESLKMWAKIVDGFRCDVASLVPLEFWKKTRKELNKVNPSCVLLAESVEPEFIIENRNKGLVCHSDAELYQAFDICYDYDIYNDFMDYLYGSINIKAYINALKKQESIYPENYVKLRFLENHDRQRIAHIIPNEISRKNWLAWMFFQKGTALIYGGQEWESLHRPSLFDLDPVCTTGEAPLKKYIQKLAKIKKSPLFDQGIYQLQACTNDIVMAKWQSEESMAIGIFSLKGKSSLIPIDLEDGEYINAINDNIIYVESRTISIKDEAIILFKDI